jgi:hypothetical protein
MYRAKNIERKCRKSTYQYLREVFPEEEKQYVKEKKLLEKLENDRYNEYLKSQTIAEPYAKLSTPQRRTHISSERPKSKINRTGGSDSYNVSNTGNIYLHRYASKRGYKILLCKEFNKKKKYILIDPIDNKISYDNSKLSIPYSVPIFESKTAALAERNVGNLREQGVIKVLVVFEYWGTIKKRHGGGPSIFAEFSKYIHIVETLDIKSCTRNRSNGPNEPHFFARPDCNFTRRNVERFPQTGRYW